MSNLTKLEFALDITGKNYLSWVLDAEIHLDAKDLGDTIKEGNKATSQNKAKAMIFLRHHLHEGLKIEYLTVKDPQVLWSNLKERYDHQKTIILPKARYDWLHLRLQDFKSVSEYNSAMFRITSQLKLCGEKITDAEMLEKTYTTFHANNVVLQTQYREKEFKKYSELISCLLVAEQNNELLMKNHESRPTGSAPFPEANATSHNGKGKYQANNSGRGRGRGYGHGRGRGRGYGYGRGRGRGGSFKNSYSHQKRDNKDDNKQEKDKNENVTNVCYRCGGKGHWSRTCRTPKHLVDLYQQSLKQKGKKIETNLVYEDGEGDFDCGNTTHLEVADFFTTPEGNN
ncbi:uncharacterized protein LOC125497814 [Beta vulgaris subsp. vulgaris]|uniref:uncharacterized protein LOC125497814 n=1 Tax=Beta vulgaris subsp. vulgaris TaxID=3555 RepID=UPI0020374CEE|nr:uncharacterized protein LOC125497814 [Beta vulgaris subsp. vulgaris]